MRPSLHSRRSPTSCRRRTSPEQNLPCDNLSFNPRHALPEHRPIGDIHRLRNDIHRLRNVVYEAISSTGSSVTARFDASVVAHGSAAGAPGRLPTTSRPVLSCRAEPC